MEKVQSLIAKVNEKIGVLLIENKSLKSENAHLVSQLNSITDDLENRNTMLETLQKKIGDLENQANTRSTAVSSIDVKKEIDSILEEIDQCLTLINK